MLKFYPIAGANVVDNPLEVDQENPLVFYLLTGPIDDFDHPDCTNDINCLTEFEFSDMGAGANVETGESALTESVGARSNSSHVRKKSCFQASKENRNNFVTNKKSNRPGLQLL